MIAKLWESYLLWRLTPAEQLIYRALKCPEEWVGDSRLLVHKRSKVALYVGDAESGAGVFDIRYPDAAYGHLTIEPRRVTKIILFPMAKRIRFPPKKSTKDRQKELFEHLMKVELGERP